MERSYLTNSSSGVVSSGQLAHAHISYSYSKFCVFLTNFVTLVIIFLFQLKKTLTTSKLDVSVVWCTLNCHILCFSIFFSFGNSFLPKNQ